MVARLLIYHCRLYLYAYDVLHFLLDFLDILCARTRCTNTAGRCKAGETARQSSRSLRHTHLATCRSHSVLLCVSVHWLGLQDQVTLEINKEGHNISPLRKKMLKAQRIANEGGLPPLRLAGKKLPPLSPSPAKQAWGENNTAATNTSVFAHNSPAPGA